MIVVRLVRKYGDLLTLNLETLVLGSRFTINVIYCIFFSYRTFSWKSQYYRYYETRRICSASYEARRVVTKVWILLKNSRFHLQKGFLFLRRSTLEWSLLRVSEAAVFYFIALWCRFMFSGLMLFAWGFKIINISIPGLGW